nr:MAG TPA: hypothetical protein [Caudoviricetes sp.]
MLHTWQKNNYVGHAKTLVAVVIGAISLNL